MTTRSLKKKKVARSGAGQQRKSPCKIQSLLVPEEKYLDSQFNVSVNPTGAVHLLNGLSLGNTGTTRVGRRITMTRVEVSLLISAKLSTGKEQFQRHMIVRDTQPNEAALTIPQVLTFNTAYSLRYQPYLTRFVVHMDRVHFLNDTNEPGSQYHIKAEFKLNSNTYYNENNTGLIGDITKNSLYYCYLGSQIDDAQAYDGNAIGTIRVWYVDS